MEQVFFEPVTADTVDALAALADEIWHEYWPDLIGADQTDYMVEQFQSRTAIVRDMREHAYEYWFLRAPGEAGEPCVAQPADNTVPHAAQPADSTVEPHAEQAVDAAASSPSGTFAGRIVGYTGGHVEPETNRFFISKIYLRAEERGKHFASSVVRFYEELCRARGLWAMYLTVNKGNELGIRAYEGNGFTTIDAVETNIGQGFIMDDYIMEKRVSPVRAS